MVASMENQTKFNVGDDVTPIDGGSRGLVIDVRESTYGELLYGVRTGNGRVDYFTERGLRSSEGMIGKLTL